MKIIMSSSTLASIKSLNQLPEMTLASLSNVAPLNSDDDFDLYGPMTHSLETFMAIDGQRSCLDSALPARSIDSSTQTCADAYYGLPIGSDFHGNMCDCSNISCGLTTRLGLHPNSQPFENPDLIHGLFGYPESQCNNCIIREQYDKLESLNKDLLTDFFDFLGVNCSSVNYFKKNGYRKPFNFTLTGDVKVDEKIFRIKVENYFRNFNYLLASENDLRTLTLVFSVLSPFNIEISGSPMPVSLYQWNLEYKTDIFSFENKSDRISSDLDIIPLWLVNHKINFYYPLLNDPKYLYEQVGVALMYIYLGTSTNNLETKCISAFVTESLLYTVFTPTLLTRYMHPHLVSVYDNLSEFVKNADLTTLYNYEALNSMRFSKMIEEINMPSLINESPLFLRPFQFGINVNLNFASLTDWVDNLISSYLPQFKAMVNIAFHVLKRLLRNMLFFFVGTVIILYAICHPVKAVILYSLALVVLKTLEISADKRSEYDSLVEEITKISQETQTEFSDFAKRPQQSEDDSLSGVLTTLGCMGALSLGNFSLSKSSCKALIKDMSFLPRAKAGMDILVESIINLIKIIRYEYYRTIVGTVPIDLNRNSLLVDEFLAKVDTLVDTFRISNAKMTDHWFSELQSCAAQATRLLRAKEYRDYHFRIEKCQRIIINILEKYKSRGYNNGGPRPAPVMLYLYGDTGQGKSSMVYPIAVDLLKITKSQSDRDLLGYKNDVYARNATQDFWDGYFGQSITVYDDFVQRKDSEMNPNDEIYEIIKSVNIFPYPLHMAHLDEKANTCFTSRFVLCSTNLPKPKISSLVSEDAVMRRITISVKVAIKDEYAKEIPSMHQSGTVKILDSEKVKALGPGFHPEIYNFYMYQIGKDGIDWASQCQISYVNLIKILIRAYSQSQDFHKDLSSYLDSEYTAPLQDWQKELYDSLHPESQLSERPQQMLGLFQATRPRIKITEPEFGVTHEFEAKYDIFPKESLFTQLADSVKNLKDYVCSRAFEIPTFNDTFLTFLKYGLIALSTLAIGYKLYDIITSFVGDKPKDKEGIPLSQFEAYNVSVPAAKKLVLENYNPPIGKQSNLKLENTSIKMESQMDENTSQLTQSIIHNNLYELCITTPTGEDKLHCMALVVVGKYVLFPYHLVIAFNRISDKTGYLLKLRKRKLVDGEVISRIHTYGLTDFISTIQAKRVATTGHICDYAVGKMNSLPQHRNIVKHFVSNYEVQTLHGGDCMMPMHSYESSLIYLHVGKFEASTQNELYTREGIDFAYLKGYFHDIQTVNGFCGAPLLVMNKRLTTGKIIGIHSLGVAKIGDRNYASAISKESLVDLIGEKNIIDDLESDHIVAPTSLENLHFQYVGDITPEVAASSSTKLEPTLLCDTYKDHVKEPALLRVDDDGFDPTEARMSKHMREFTHLDEKTVQQVGSATMNFLSGKIAQCNSFHADLYDNLASCYDSKTSIEGTPGSDYVGALFRNTSAGFPYVTQKVKGKEGKTTWFGDGDSYNYDSPECQAFLKQLRNTDTLLRNQVRPRQVYLAWLKDELKLKHKKKKSRIFMASNMEYAILMRRYMMGAFALLKRSRNFHGLAPGTNPYSQDWTRLHSILISKGDRILAGDFGAADSSHFPQLFECINMIFNGISRRFTDYEPVHDLCRQILLLDVNNPSVAVKGKSVFELLHSLASGTPGTDIINSLYFLLLLCYAFVKITGLPAEKFYTECGTIMYGDDHCVSVSAKLIEKFNLKTLQDFFTSIGVEYTDINKEPVMTKEFYTFDEVSFIKRTFTFDDDAGRFIAPLDLDTILETPMWIRKAKDPQAATLQNLETALRELSLHSKETWDEWYPKMQEACLQNLYTSPESASQEYYRDIALKTETYF